MHYKCLICLSLLLFQVLSFSQGEIQESVSRSKLIKRQLVKVDFKKIEALERDEKVALELMQVSDKNYEELAKISQLIEEETNKKKLKSLLQKSAKFETKAIKHRVESLKSYHQVFVQRYKIYKSDLKKFFSVSDQNLVDSAIVLEKLAYNAFEKADRDEERVYYTINPTDLFKIFTRAYQSEQLGLLYQEKMYAVFLYWGTEICNSLDEEIIAFQNNEPEKKDQIEEIKIPVKDSIIVQKIIVYDTIQVQNSNDVVISEDVIYKVQIAAATSQINPENLKKKYPSVHLIHAEFDNGWYKYTVGNFTQYKDAQRFKINTGVSDAFIVAYRNGKRTPITELVNHTSFAGNK